MQRRSPESDGVCDAVPGASLNCDFFFPVAAAAFRRFLFTDSQIDSHSSAVFPLCRTRRTKGTCVPFPLPTPYLASLSVDRWKVKSDGDISLTLTLPWLTCTSTSPSLYPFLTCSKSSPVEPRTGERQHRIDPSCSHYVLIIQVCFPHPSLQVESDFTNRGSFHWFPCVGVCRRQPSQCGCPYLRSALIRKHTGTLDRLIIPESPLPACVSGIVACVRVSALGGRVVSGRANP